MVPSSDAFIIGVDRLLRQVPRTRLVVVNAEAGTEKRSTWMVFRTKQADGIWRRRRMLVLCRAHDEKGLRGDSGLFVGKCFSQVKRVGSDNSAGWGRVGQACDVLGWIVSRLEAEEGFRAIVEFLQRQVGVVSAAKFVIDREDIVMRPFICFCLPEIEIALSLLGFYWRTYAGNAGEVHANITVHDATYEPLICL